jgi:beta-glucosidase
VGSDNYRRFEQDIALMAELGVQAYRFSVSWPRIQPDGTGPPNERGLDHYRRLVECLNSNGIAPVLTLYHWDLPQALEDAGGWPARDTASRFADYAAIVHGVLAEAVPLWITLNEPWVAAWLGYGTGVHAPGRKDDALAIAAAHHLLLAHGLARDAMGADTGISLNLEPHRPASGDAADREAAHLADLHMNALFLDPLFGRGYPEVLLDRYAQLGDVRLVRADDLATIAGPLSFLGVNYYRPQTIAAARRGSDPVEVPGSIGAWAVTPPGSDVTAMGWPIEPFGLTELLERVSRDYAPPRLLVTENGGAFDDHVVGTAVHDIDRIAFLERHIRAAGAAIEAGVSLSGYFVWSFLDNFEWAEGYDKRFGLVHVDRVTQERTPKDSAYWYRNLIRSAAREE